MDTARKNAVKARLEALKKENDKLKNKLSILNGENRELQKDHLNIQRILDELPSPIILIKNDEIILSNAESWTFLGYTRQEYFNRNLPDLVHSLSRDHVRQTYHEYSAGKPLPGSFEIYLKKKDGTPLYCEVFWKKILYQGRSAILLNVMALDKWRRREKEMLRMEKDQAIKRLISGLFEDDGDKPRSVDHVSQKAEKILNALGILSPGDADTSEMKVIDLKKVVQDAVAAGRIQSRESDHDGIQIKTYLRNISSVLGHPEKLQAALEHLIQNAIEAVKEYGEIYLTTEENAGYAWIYIQDNGGGIDDDMEHQIFDPFFTTKANGHKGLGLSLTNAIITQHGGEIKVINREGQGASFVIKLPLYTAPVKKKDVGRPKNHIRDAFILALSQGNILMDILIQELAGRGGRITEVTSFAEGLNILKKKKVDLIVADMASPDLMTKKAIKDVLPGKWHSPFVLVDTVGNRKSVHQYEKSGADFVLKKPLEMKRIFRQISEIIQYHKASK